MTDDEPSAWAKDFMRWAQERTQNARIVFQIGDRVMVNCIEIGDSTGTINRIWGCFNGTVLYGVEVDVLPIYKTRWFREDEIKKVNV